MATEEVTEVTVIPGGPSTIEVQWGTGSGARGYVLIEGNELHVPFRNDADEPFVFVLAGGDTRIVNGEDVPTGENDPVVWRANKEG